MQPQRQRHDHLFLEHLRKWSAALSEIDNKLSAIERKNTGLSFHFLEHSEFFEDTPADKAYYDILNKRQDHENQVQEEEERELKAQSQHVTRGAAAGDWGPVQKERELNTRRRAR